jgi:hypothetical protein
MTTRDMIIEISKGIKISDIEIVHNVLHVTQFYLVFFMYVKWVT